MCALRSFCAFIFRLFQMETKASSNDDNHDVTIYDDGQRVSATRKRQNVQQRRRVPGNGERLATNVTAPCI